MAQLRFFAAGLKSTATWFGKKVLRGENDKEIYFNVNLEIDCSIVIYYKELKKSQLTRLNMSVKRNLSKERPVFVNPS